MPIEETSSFCGRREEGDHNSDLQIREGDGKKVDLQDEEDFNWRRMRMMAFPKGGITGTMAWRHETFTNAEAIQLYLLLNPTTCPAYTMRKA